MRLYTLNYRFAEEILTNDRNRQALEEIETIAENCPLPIWRNKSATNPNLDVSQQVMNSYFDRMLHVNHGWDYHPPATAIPDSGLAADFRKEFPSGLRIQVEVQFGNASRFYADIFKCQTAASQHLCDLGLIIVPTADLARRIDSNVASFERAAKELPSAKFQITIPILLIGMEVDDETTIIDLRATDFGNYTRQISKGPEKNRLRIIDAFLNNRDYGTVDEDSPVGPVGNLNPT